MAGQVRTLASQVRLDARTKLLNPKWYEGMLSSGYEGVREIQKRLTNTMGWSATAGAVDGWVYDEANATFIDDPDMAKRRAPSTPPLPHASAPCLAVDPVHAGSTETHNWLHGIGLRLQVSRACRAGVTDSSPSACTQHVRM